MYARLAQAVSRCDDAQQFAHIQKDISKKLIERTPSSEEFELNFRGLQFNSNYTRDRALVRYVLRKLSQHYGLAQEINPATYTIEHLKPDHEFFDEVEWAAVGNIGNLLFVPENVNKALGVKQLPQKLRILEEHHVPMDPFLKGATTWGTQMIADRAVALAEVAHSKIWKV